MKRINLHYLIYIISVSLMISCANRSGGPQGGPQDVTPPVVKKTSPENGAKSYNKNRIEIYFNEYVSIENPQAKVVVSPPQQTPASVRADRKRIIVELNDTLQKNTCYSIDFTDAIVDLNEKNPLKNYVFSFSTDEVIDSMQISGIVLDALTLERKNDILIALYPAGNDSAFKYQKPLRIARTNSRGEFKVQAVKDGTYNIYALDDSDGNYFLSSNSESFAFLDKSIKTSMEIAEVTDTIHRDSISGGDSIFTVKKTKYLPDDIEFFLCKNEKKTQQLLNPERKVPHLIQFLFKYKNNVKPIITPLDTVYDFAIKYNPTADTLSYYVLDSTKIETEKLLFAVTYETLDSVFAPTLKTDTVKAFFGKKLLKDRKKESQYFNIEHDIKGDLDYFRNITLKLDAPVKEFYKEKIHLKSTLDSVWTDLDFDLKIIDSLQTQFELVTKTWNAEQKYVLEIDSAAFRNPLGVVNQKLKKEFNIRPAEKFSTLTVFLNNYEPRAIIQLLSDKEKVVCQKKATEDGTLFEHIMPGKYFLRLFIDENGDEEITPADFEAHRQCEKVYYLNSELTLRMNWDVEQEWDYLLIEPKHQRPKELIVNAQTKNN